MLDETLPPASDSEPGASANDAPAGNPPQPDAPAPEAAAATPAAAVVDAAVPVQDPLPSAAAAAPAPEMSPAACATELSQRFPALFAAGRALPIKLRIQVDIQARAPGVFTRKAMSLFLHRYTTSTAYLKALVASPQRFDLDGAPAGEIAAEHREAATVELQRRQAIVQERRAAERRAARPQRPQPQGGAGAAPAAAAGDIVEQPGPPPGDRPRPQRTRRDDRRPLPPGGRPAAGQHPQDRRGERQARPPWPPRPPGPQPQRRDSGEDRAAAPDQRAAAHASLPPAELEARRDRASLLRAYESSTLTKANFCVLKRISEAELDSQLAMARSEQPQRPGGGAVNPQR